MNRDDFPMLKQDIIYFDNAATSFKPKLVINEIIKYYENYSASAHRSDYQLSNQVDEMYDEVRIKVAEFINAKAENEIVFTAGTTDSINIIVNGYLKNILKSGDEVLVTKSEHASLLLPLFNLVLELGIVIKYIPLNDEHKITMENVLKSITKKTKVIALAHITNVIGDIRPIKQICAVATNHNIVTVIDGAQSISHTKIDVIDLNADFFCFSGHKMYGPTGIGILYGKHKLLDKIIPTKVGGGMNAAFYSDGIIEYKDIPEKLEAGTQNIAGIIGLGAAIDYLNTIGMDNVALYEKKLSDYLVLKLKGIDNVKIYNSNPDSSIVTFNVGGIFPQDLALYLDKYNICVRAGSHCAKILKDNIGIKNTCRISLALYNSRSEVDKLIEVLNNKNILKELI